MHGNYNHNIYAKLPLHIATTVLQLARYDYAYLHCRERCLILKGSTILTVAIAHISSIYNIAQKEQFMYLFPNEFQCYRCKHVSFKIYTYVLYNSPLLQCPLFY